MKDPAAQYEPAAAPPVVWGPRWAVIGIFLLLAVAGLAYARAFLMPTVLAFLLSLVFGPVRRFLQRRGVPSGVSALLITGSLLLVLVASVVTLAAPVSGWIDDAPLIRREIELKLRDLTGKAQEVREVAKQVEEIAEGEKQPGVQEVVVQEQGLAASAALVAPAALAQVVFTLVLLFFLLASGDMFYEKIVEAMPTFADKRRAVRIAHDIERKLSRYLFTITVINAGLGVAIGLAMWGLGMPNPLLFAALGFLLNYIPYLGAIAGVAIAFAVALVGLDSLGDALVAGGVYLGLTAIEGQFITPYFVGRSLRLNTVVVFLSVTLWAWLWSVVGMLVATPLLVTVRAFCEHIPSLQPFGHFLSERGAELPVPEEPAAEPSPPPK
jgi:predicted PurR-regulated permease PerM